ncbi:mitochondrial import protein Pam17 [Infundibulicybe gibba]|nr:mitochondrial import protein Pam17 [Infundibulicybe gibba]
MQNLLRPTTLPFRCAGRQSTKRFTAFSRPNSTSSVNPRVVEQLTWPEYLAIRRGRRNWQTALTIPSAILGFAGGVAYFGTLETDATKPIWGIDPFFFYGICTVGCVGLGFLVGPSLGSFVWRATHRRSVALIDARDREFYQRIAKNRVDASLQSPTNPIPDYYGEKIGSIHQYRQWLRDQAKYKKKALLSEKS